MSEQLPPPASNPDDRPVSGFTPPSPPTGPADGPRPAFGPPAGGPPGGGPPTGPFVPVQPSDGDGGRPWWKGPVGIVAAVVVVVGLIVGGVALTRSDDKASPPADTDRPRRTFDTRPQRTDPTRTDASDTTSDTTSVGTKATNETTSPVDTDPGFTLPPLTDPPTTVSRTSTTNATTPPAGAVPIGTEATVKDDGITVRITLLQIVDDAPARKFLEPEAGNKYVAVQVRIVNDGPNLYRDVVSYGAQLIDTDNQQFDSAFSDSPLGPELSLVSARAGDVRSGWITFEVPKTSSPAQLQINPFFTGDPARWDLAAAPVQAAPAPAVLPADVPLNAPATVKSSDGSTITVTATQLVDPAEPEYGEVTDGTRLIAVKMTFTNSGTTAFSDSPVGAVAIIDASGQVSRSTYTDTKAGPGFDGTVDLAPGESRTGFIGFEVPATATPVKLQVDLYGDDSVELGLV